MLTVLLLGALLGSQSPAAPAGVVAAIQIQGNAVVSSEEVTRLSGLVVGQPFDAGTVAKVESALRASRRFEHVEALQRYASLDDPSQIVIVIIVDEGPLKLKGRGPGTTIVRSGGPHLLFSPLVSYEDGYGFAYGARFAKPGLLGNRSRISFPLTWGGDKHAGVDLDKAWARGPLSRGEVSLFTSRRTNPFDAADDDRTGVKVSGDRDVTGPIRVGAWGSVAHVSFLAARDRVTEAAVNVTLDTRHDPFLARNALYARAEVGHVGVAGGVSARRASLDARAYLGLIRQSILVVGVSRQSADQSLPLYLKPLLGGMESLRGFRAGYKAGDTVVNGTTELRVPLTSPLSLARVGVSVFADAGTAYQHGERFRDQTVDRGYGTGAWFVVSAVRLRLDVAHGAGAGTRMHFGSTISF
ncbi:MAG TPA: BamA/TamA family outer membrane protein [Vicinamibacterales bacterium]|jgi:outer membrane protein assembly factor BamA|nr:BamA/TamA family outer membrane protein [Vicinamibacterales bacterium]